MAVLSLTGVVTLAALVPAIGGMTVGGTSHVADSVGAVVGSIRVLTAVLLLSLAPVVAGAELSAASAAFGLSGLVAFAASAAATLFPEAAAAGGISAEALELDARAALPLGLALAVVLPWERQPVRSGRAAAFGFATLALAIAAAPLVVADVVRDPAPPRIDPDISHVFVAALAALAIIAVRRRPGPLWRWALVAAVASAAAAWTRIAAMPLSIGWYVSLALSLVATGVVLVGVTLDAGRGLREAAVLRVRRRFEARIERMALYDEVTGLPNAHQVTTRIDEALAAGGEAALVTLALEGLEDVLDAFGRQRLDGLLRAAAARLERSLGARGMVARVGDEELALLLAGSPRDLLAVAGQAVRALDDPFDVGGIALTVGAVAGGARAPRDGADGELIVRRAGLAARAARTRGRQAIEYSEGLETHRPDQIALLGELRPAILRGELVLFYQPKARLRDRAIVGAEALVRWRHPSRGLLPPSDFIPLAERSDVITDLTLWAIGAAAERCAAWRRQGLALSVAVNLPARSIADTELPAQVEDALERSGVDPAWMRLEITESDAMADIERSLRRLRALRGLGVALAVDDFGTGYSSLAYLARLPIDEVKIDASFVRVMRTDPASATIVRSAVELCHHLGYSATAEGAEDMETWAALADLGCDVVQGYVVGRPVPPDDLVAGLRATGWMPPE